MFGTLPPGTLYFYPYRIYSEYMLTTGLPIIMDLLTFHLVHWFTGIPGEPAIHLIKMLTVASCAIFAVVGAGPKRIFAILTYCLVIYLWGFVYMMGQDFDAVFIYQGVLFCLMFSKHQDLPLWDITKKSILTSDMDAGRSFSSIVLIFVIYYFGSGINKLSDIDFVQWFSYKLIESIELMIDCAKAGDMTQPPEIFKYLGGQYWLNYLSVPAVYVSHLGAPFAFFRRKLILEFAFFYMCFHFIVMGVGIAFTGYLFVWFMLLNISAPLSRLMGVKAKGVPA